MLPGPNEDLLTRGSHYGADGKLAATASTIKTFQILFLAKVSRIMGKSF